MSVRSSFSSPYILGHRQSIVRRRYRIHGDAINDVLELVQEQSRYFDFTISQDSAIPVGSLANLHCLRVRVSQPQTAVFSNSNSSSPLSIFNIPSYLLSHQWAPFFFFFFDSINVRLGVQDPM